MRNLGLLVAVGLLLTGAAPCEGNGDDEGMSEGGGDQGGGGSTEPEGGCSKQPCSEAGGGGGGGDGDSGGRTAGSGGTVPAGGAGSGAAGGGDEPAPSAPRCEGFAGTPCPGAGSCVDDPSDDCDPEMGGANCGGLCECSGAAVLCAPNTTFDDDPNVCDCVAADAGGDDGGGVTCGPSTCAAGQVCCNESCGICTEPSGACTQEACEPPAAGESCDLTCDAGQHCELVPVTCIRAPCPPQPQCVPSPSCAGFAGLACPGEGECVDDPSDDCDPEMGGADCGGYCTCTVGPLIDCAADHRFDPSPATCACVKPTAPIDGVTCGKVTCAAGEVCCNESCGICTPPDGACIDLFCG